MEVVTAVQNWEGSVMDRVVNAKKAHIDSSSSSGCHMDELFTVVQLVFHLIDQTETIDYIMYVGVKSAEWKGA